MQNKDILTKYRIELFGVAAIGIIIRHSPAVISFPNIIDMNSALLPFGWSIKAHGMLQCCCHFI